jgi:hypothetical protein
MKELSAVAVALVLLAGCGEYEREEWEVALIAHEWEQFYPLNAGHPSARAIAYSEEACSKKGAVLRNGWLAYSEEASKSAQEKIKQLWEANAQGAPNESELSLLTVKVDRLTRFINSVSVRCRIVNYDKISLSSILLTLVANLQNNSGRQVSLEKALAAEQALSREALNTIEELKGKLNVCVAARTGGEEGSSPFKGEDAAPDRDQVLVDE